MAAIKEQATMATAKCDEIEQSRLLRKSREANSTSG